MRKPSKATARPGAWSMTRRSVGRLSDGTIVLRRHQLQGRAVVALQSVVRQELDRGSPVVTVDLSALDHLGGEGADVFVTLAVAASHRGVRLVLRGLARQPADRLGTLGLARLVRLEPRLS